MCAPDDGKGIHPKHAEQFTEINCVTLHLVGYTLEHICDARTLEHRKRMRTCIAFLAEAGGYPALFQYVQTGVESSYWVPRVLPWGENFEMWC